MPKPINLGLTSLVFSILFIADLAFVYLGGVILNWLFSLVLPFVLFLLSLGFALNSFRAEKDEPDKVYLANISFWISVPIMLLILLFYGFLIHIAGEFAGSG